MILIYSHKITNRLKYSFKVIFTDILKTEVDFTSDIKLFESSDLPKINYSKQKLDSGIYFQPAHLLYETGIKEQDINIFSFNENPCFFKVSNESTFPFDPFSASFYLMSRYEEYLPQIRDSHDRFTAKESLAFQNNFLHLPLINIWANKIAQTIEKNYPKFKFPDQNFEYISTIDIDNAYAYKHKGFIRTIGGLLNSLIKRTDFKQRINVLLNKAPDPYDTFKYQYNIHKKYDIKPIYFFLLGDYALNDKNIPVRSKTFQSLIKSISDYYEVGIHPSYTSNSDTQILVKEIKRLQDITHRNVIKSRQHFLKLNLPYTYRNLIDNDILYDYTMGYAGAPGFRASICSPYHFYDLDNESESNLIIMPFAIMEATFQYYLQVPAKEALNEIIKLMSTVKQLNGTFISVWHNESLSDDIKIWKGWREVYETMLIESIK